MIKLKSILNEKYLGFGNQGRRPVTEQPSPDQKARKRAAARNANPHNNDQHAVKIEDIDPHSIKFEDVHGYDHPDYVDAYISYAEFKNGESLTDEQMEWVQEEHGDWVYDRLHNYLN